MQLVLIYWKSWTPHPLTPFKPSSISLYTWNRLLTGLPTGTNTSLIWKEKRMEKWHIWQALHLLTILSENSYASTVLFFILEEKHESNTQSPEGIRKHVLCGLWPRLSPLSHWTYWILCFIWVGEFFWLSLWMNLCCWPCTAHVHRHTGCLNPCRIRGCRRAPDWVFTLKWAACVQI